MLLLSVFGLLSGGYCTLYAIHCFKQKKAPAGAGAILLTLFCLLMAGLIILC